MLIAQIMRRNKHWKARQDISSLYVWTNNICCYEVRVLSLMDSKEFKTDFFYSGQSKLGLNMPSVKERKIRPKDRKGHFFAKRKRPESRERLEQFIVV